MEKYNDTIAKMDSVELVQVSGDRDLKQAEAWAKKESLPWPAVMMADIPKTMIKDIKFPGYPTYVLIDKDGKEITRGLSSAEIFKKVEELTQ